MLYVIDSFEGGLSEDPYRGLKGAFQYGYGLDIRRQKDTLTCNQKLKKDSGTTVTELLLFMVSSSNGNMYGFGDAGGIYKMTTGTGVWSKLSTYSGTDGAGARICGACEFTNYDGVSAYVPYIYFATKSKLSRILVSNDAITQDWQALSDVSTTGWHTMAEAVGTLQIANTRYLAFVDYEGGYTISGLDFPATDTIKTVIGRDNSVLAASAKKLFTWDRLQDSWLNRREVPDVNIDAMIDGNGILVHSGSTLYYWDTTTLQPIRQMLRSDHVINPGGIVNFKGVTYMGVNGATDVGVYSYGTKSSTKPRSFNFESVLSHGKTAAVSIGSLLVHNNTLYISWKDSTTYGVDVIDTANKATGRYEGLRFRGKTVEQNKYSYLNLLLEPLPTGCSVAVQYKINGQSAWQSAKLTNGAPTFNVSGATKAVFKMDPDPKYGGEEIELGLTLTPSSNTAPDIKSIVTSFDIIGNK